MSQKSDYPKPRGRKPEPAMGMAYRPRSIGRQLSDYAAKRAIRVAIDSVARHAERKLFEKLDPPTRRINPRHANHGHDISNKRKGKRIMFTKENTRTSNSPAARNASRRNDEPVELWVNTVVVVKDGDEPIRIGSGRPLHTMKTDKPVNTSNEDFNRANAISNAVITEMNTIAKGLDKETGYVLAPKRDEGEPLPAGTYLQVYRSKLDAEDDAAIKADAEDAARAELGSLFG